MKKPITYDELAALPDGALLTMLDFCNRPEQRGVLPFSRSKLWELVADDMIPAGRPKPGDRRPHSKDDLGPGIEVQTDGAYVMVPPFFGYTVENDVFFDELVPPPWPGKMPRAAERRVPPIGDIDPEVRAHINTLYESEQAGGWHNAMVRIVAYLVVIGWTDAHILRFSFQWTNAGYTPQETFEDVAIAIEGARAKWQQETEPKTTDEARLRTIAENWARSTPEGRKVIYEAIKAAAEGGTE